MLFCLFQVGTARRPALRDPRLKIPVEKAVEKAHIRWNMSYQNIITLEPGKRGGRPCIRRMRIAVSDVLGWLAAGMSHQEILSDYPELTEEDIRACLAYAADRERRVLTAA